MERRRWLSDPIVRAIDHVDRGLGGRLGLAEMAGAAGLSAYHFHRRFRRETGETPAAFVERLRLERAALLLLADGAPITHLAWDVGFRNPETLARRFRARFGVTARDYRRHQLSSWRRLGLQPGRDFGGAAGEVEVRRIPRLVVEGLHGIGGETGFDFDRRREPWTEVHAGREPGTSVGVTFDWAGITPPERVRQFWGRVVTEADEDLPRRARCIPGLLYATLRSRGTGPVPAEVYQRLFVWSLAGGYRLRPGPIVEIERRGEILVYQPVREAGEGFSNVRVRAGDRQAGQRRLPGLQRSGQHAALADGIPAPRADQREAR